jgi:cytochrome c-type biogenesis protein CcmH/NrfF
VSRRRIVVLALTAALGATMTASTMTSAAAQASPSPKTSYLQVVDDVMCVVCHEPLGVAQSPEAFQERGYIRQLIAQGKTRAQIEDDLVAEYGPAVLSRPPAHGINLLVYIVPPLVLILGIATIAVFIPRWRRRARDADSATAQPTAALDAADAQRLNEDLGRFA